MAKALYAVLLILVAGFLAAYFYLDRKVVAYLERRTTPQPSAIYSDELKVDSRSNLKINELVTQLQKRRYREVSTLNTPGEYNTGENLLSVLTREFIGPDGVIHKSQRVDFKLPEPAPTFSLEPQIIALLGGSEVRASELKGLDSFPEQLRHAVIAIEDERFFSHHGIDIEGMGRALIENIRALSIVQGGSTITQQLAKNLFFTARRTFSRKFQEMVAALSLERHLSKNEILEAYLNEVYLGQEGAVAIHGFAEAAKTFYGKKVDDLELGEAALLAGIIKAPSYFSPRKHLERARERRNLVLDKMLELKFISSKQAEAAKKAPLNILQENLHARRAPYFVAALQHELGEILDLDAATAQGLSVYTGLDVDLQQCAESALEAGLANLEKTYPKLKREAQSLEGGLVAIEPFSGKIRAWAGGRDYALDQFDHVSQAKRQIGSTIKPFLYLTALDGTLNKYKVATPISILSDRPMTIQLVTRDSWEPENYDREYHGDVTLRYALENSLNLPAVYTAQKFGFETLARTVHRFHISESVLAVPSLALGAADTTLLDLSAAYGALANGGLYIRPRPFISVVDSQGQILHASPISEEQLADPNAVYVLTNIMQGVIERGTAKTVRRLGYTGVAAGKTGTSNDTRDAWFVAFNPELAAGVWVGFDDNAKTGLTGALAAAPIWTQFMQCASQFRDWSDFAVPPGVVSAKVDVVSGELSTSGCPPEDVAQEVFVRGTEPTRPCRYHGGDFAQPPLPGVPEPAFKKRSGRSFWERLFGG